MAFDIGCGVEITPPSCTNCIVDEPGRIWGFIIVNPASVVASPNLLATWDALVASDDAFIIRNFRGSRAAAENVTQPGYGGVETRTVGRNHTITGSLSYVCDDIPFFNAIRRLATGAQLWWWNGSKIYQAQGLATIDSSMIVPESTTEVQTREITITWSAMDDDACYVKPAGIDVCPPLV